MKILIAYDGSSFADDGAPRRRGKEATMAA
jgi:hypothetical protein